MKYLLENVSESLASFCQPFLEKITNPELKSRDREDYAAMLVDYVNKRHQFIEQQLERFDEYMKAYREARDDYNRENGILQSLPKTHKDREAQAQRQTAAYMTMKHAEMWLPPTRRFTEIDNEVSELTKLTEYLGAQLGPNYLRGPDAKYSGPQNPPLKPSGDSAFIMSDSECWCIYCNEKVEKSKQDKMSPCEHLVHSKCHRMLSSKVTMPNDKRVYQYGQLPKHPHATEQP